MDLDGHVLGFPGESFIYRNGCDESDALGIATVLNAVDALREGWEPLSAEAVVATTEGDDIPLRKPHWLLTRTSVPVGVVLRATWVDPVRADVATLSRLELEAWLNGALRACGVERPGLQPEWRELRFDACRARLGPPSWRADREALRLRTEAGALVAPLERDDRGTWVSGPREPAWDQAPLKVLFTQQWGLLSVHITVSYGFWLDEREPAAAELNRARASLEALEWERR
ncbi:hypothetical protein [Sorangium sp. So ce861]|uniref:hypothetical protein n=1 Tax=Sorangium sp. So ce861 TaxID=3133323 RepID=UPI003F6318A9